jgi:hypothetical protein
LTKSKKRQTHGGIYSQQQADASNQKKNWFLLNHEYVEGFWEPTDTVGWELLIPSDSGSSSWITSVDINESGETLGVRDC